MRTVLVLFLFVCILPLKAQQDILFSQYMFNQFVINPAYAGTRDAFSGIIGHREQWTAIEGAPSSTTLSLHSPFGERVGVGLQLYNEQIGPKNSLTYLGTYSYRLPLFGGKLSMGLRLGGITYQVKWGDIDYKDKTDIYNLENTTSATAFNADFGLFYYTERFFLGLSGNHIATNLKLTEISNNGAEQYLNTHLFLSTGYTIPVSGAIDIQPSILLRATETGHGNADLNLNFLFEKRFWIGASYRNQNAVVILTQLYFTPAFRMGYSYDMGINKIGNAGKGAHEIFIGLDLKKKRGKIIHPRYF